MDLDQSGRGFQRVRTYLGPSLGWTEELVQPTTEIKQAGGYNVQPGDSVILVNVAAAVQINLPDVTSWIQQTAYLPATGFDRSITIKDLGGNAQNFNIVVAPFGSQFIDNISQAVVISTARAVIKFIPLIDQTGWALEQASVGGGGGGGGDVFKAGNNTFTGTNIFNGPTTAPTQAPADDSTHVATTAFVKAQGYLTDVSLDPYAPILDPVFEGDPRAPTVLQSQNDDTIATTAFVHTATANFQPLDDDLNSIAAASSSGAGPAGSGLYYRKSPGVWAPLNLAGLSISTATDTITSAAGGGNVSSVNNPQANQLAQWTGPNSIQGIDISALGYALIASPVFTGDPRAPTPANADNDTSIATTAFVKNTSQPLDGDLTAIAALTGTNTMYYRSATDIWSPVVMGSNMAFAGGVLSASLGGGAVPEAPNDGGIYARQSLSWLNITTSYQPLDADLTSLAAASAFGAGPTPSGLYYRKNVNVWAPLNLGTGFSINGSTDTINFTPPAGGASVKVQDTPPVGPAQGDLWWESDSGTLFISYNDGTSTQWVSTTGSGGGAGNVVASGTPTVGQIAVWTNSTTVQGLTPVAAVPPGALIEISRQVAANGQNIVTFATGIDTTYDEYEVHFYDVICAVANSNNFALQGSQDGGATWVQTSDYQWGFTVTGSVGSFTVSQNAGSYPAGVISTAPSGAIPAAPIAGKVTFWKPLGTPGGSSRVIMTDIVGHSNSYSYFRIQGSTTLSRSSFNAIRFFWDAGANYVSGTFVLYGRKK